ncbi:MAG: PAS domain-containing protein [Cyanobacteria bacterium J06659_2]
MSVLWKMMAMDTPVFPADMPLVAAARRSLQRSPALVYEPVVVQYSEAEYGVLDVHDLLLAQSQIQELTTQALRQSQQALATEKELAQITLQSIGDGVITTDGEGRIESLNAVAEALLGWRTDEAKGQPLHGIF